MSKAYDPSARANAMVVKYKVNATGDRWFIPYNDNGTKAAQVAQCSKVVGNTAEEMLDQAEELIDIGPNITIKVPCTPQGLKACKDLTDDEVSVNVTLIFSAAQAILASKAGATFVSPFVGRVFDQSFDGIGLIEEISDIFATHGAKTQVLAASVREVYQVAQAFKVGADICTIPSKIFQGMFSHILTDKGLEIFDKDWKKLQEELGTT